MEKNHFPLLIFAFNFSTRAEPEVEQGAEQDNFFLLNSFLCSLLTHILLTQ
jgi:hypothetical protein